MGVHQSSGGARDVAGSHSGRRSLRLAGVLAVALPECGCAVGIMDPRGPVASQDLTIMIDALVIMLAIGVPTILAGLGLGWWHRASNRRAKYLPEWAYSGRLELLVWSIPILVIMFLGGVIWIGSYRLDPAQPLPSKAPPLNVQVVSLDWKWLFIYPDQGLASVNQLVVPAGRPVHFELTSASVMNMFFVPQLGSMIATMNGMVTHLNLQADQPGQFYGESTQFSGDHFSDMNFTVHAVPQAQFDAWVAAAHGAGPALDANAYAALSRQGTVAHPFTYRAVQPGLFQQVASLKLPPGPGPNAQASPVRTAANEAP